MRVTLDMLASLKDYGEVIAKLNKELGRKPTEDDIYRYYGITNTRKRNVLFVLVGGAGSNMYPSYDELLAEQEWADFEYLFIDSIKRKDYISKIVSGGRKGYANYIALDIVKGEAWGPELEKKKREISCCMKGKDIIVISVGLGGFVGSNVAPYVAELAKEAEPAKIVVGDYILPFDFEGKERMRIAIDALELLEKNTDECDLLDMSKELGTVDRRTSIAGLFDTENKKKAACVVKRLNEICVPDK